MQFDTGANFQHNVDINGDSAGLTGFVKAGTGFQNNRDVLSGGWAYVQATPTFRQFPTDNKPCRLTPWFFATPVLQYYRHPNTRSDLRDIAALGTTTKNSF